MYTDLPDEALMLHYRLGDLAAFKELYGRHRQGLYQFIAWRSPRRDWVDEIVQDSWASLHSARSTYQPQASFKTFLYQIARNRLIDLLRQKQPVSATELGGGQKTEEAEETGSHFDYLAAAADLAGGAVSPQDALEAKQQIAGLHAAIHALPGEQKEALILQQFNGMSLDEIAVLTGVAVETVKSRLRYAMNKLRRRMLDSAAQSELV